MTGDEDEPAAVRGATRRLLLLVISVSAMPCASRTDDVRRPGPARPVGPATARATSGRPLGLDLYRPEPPDNPTLPATVALGRRLFQEPLLSRDRSLTCVDCHRPELAFTDGRARSVGVSGRRGPRSVPIIVNRAWGKSLLWDGRIETLEEVIDFYDRGGRENPYRDRELRPLSLTPVEKAALLAFLRSLSGEIREGLVRP